MEKKSDYHWNFKTSTKSPLCSFVPFVVNQALAVTAVLCRTLPLAKQK